MKITSLLTTAMFAALLIGAACTQTNTRKSEADAVKQALQQADLKDVTTRIKTGSVTGAR